MTVIRFGDTAAGQSAPPGAVAATCAALGWRVFPLRSDTRTPAMGAWPDVATTDRDTIRSWWTGRYSACGVGIATGPESGLWVVDIDVKKGGRGFDTLRELCDRSGAALSDLDTFCVRTPSGGAHLYWLWDASAGSEGGIANSTGERGLGRGVDVRGVRGYVRAPGLDGYQVVGARIRAVAAPVWLSGLCKRRRGGDPAEWTNADIRAARLRRERLDPGIDTALSVSRAIDRLSRAGSGTRNDALNRAAWKLGMLAATGSGVGRAEALRACLSAASASGARDDRAQQERTFESGWRSGLEAGAASVMQAEVETGTPAPGTGTGVGTERGTRDRP